MSGESERDPAATGKQTPFAAADRSRAVNLLALRAVVAAYLVYLGASLIYGELTGASSLPPAAAWLAGLLFLVGGGLFGLFTWRRWRAESETAKQPPENDDAP